MKKKNKSYHKIAVYLTDRMIERDVLCSYADLMPHFTQNCFVDKTLFIIKEISITIFNLYTVLPDTRTTIFFIKITYRLVFVDGGLHVIYIQFIFTYVIIHNHL